MLHIDPSFERIRDRISRPSVTLDRFGLEFLAMDTNQSLLFERKRRSGNPPLLRNQLTQAIQIFQS